MTEKRTPEQDEVAKIAEEGGKRARDGQKAATDWIAEQEKKKTESK